MGGFHRPSGALEYWGDVELVKSMHLKKPMQVKLGKSDKAKTHLVKKDEVVKYHLAWVSYNATSGKYKNATHSPGHLKLHTQLQRDPQLVFQSPSTDGDFEEIAGVVATGTILIICWYQVMEDGFWVWAMTIEEVD